MPYTPTNEDIEWMIKNRKKQTDDEGSGFLQKAGDIAGHINRWARATRVPALVGGAVQGVEHGLASAANLPLELMGAKARVPYAHLEKQYGQDPITQAVFTGGEIAGSLAPGLGAFKAIKGARAIPAVISKLGKAGLGGEVAAGAGAGALTGAISEDDVAGRVLGGIGGSIVAPARALHPRVLASRILKAKKAVEKKFSKKYDNIFDQLKQSNLHEKPLRVPTFFRSSEAKAAEKKILYKAINPKARKSMDLFTNNPTFERAHKAQSDLGKAASKKGEYQLDKDSANLARDLRKRVQGSMQYFLLKQNRKDLAKEYMKTTKEFKEKVIPFRSPLIKKFEKTGRDPLKLIKALRGEEKFMDPSIRKQIPGMSTRARIEPSIDILKKLALGGAIGTAGAGGAVMLGVPGADYLLHHLSRGH